MAIAKCDNAQAAKTGGAASLSGNVRFYDGKAASVSDPTALDINKVLGSRYLAGPWRGEVLPQTASDRHAPAANTAAVVTYAALEKRRHVIFGIAYSYKNAPTNGNLKVEDGSGTTIFSLDITGAGSDEIHFPEGLKGSINTAMIITLSAGGASVEGEVNIVGRRVE